MELDNIDKKILYQLSVDARQSYKQIAQKIKSKKDTVAYHITQMQKKGLITKYVPVFSLTRLGIYAGKVYLRLQGLSEEDEKKIIDTLVKNPYIVWVAKCVGTWDLLIGMHTSDIIDFAAKKNQILSEFSEFISDYAVTFIEDGLVFHRDYLLGTPITYRKEFLYGGTPAKIDVKDDEKKIMQAIKNDGRFEYADVAQRLGMDSRTVQNNIKNMKDKGVLQGYTCFIDIKKLGFQLHKLCIYLKEHKKENIDRLVKYLKQNPPTIHLIKALGSWELEVEIETDDLNQVYDHISELKNKFPDMIRKIELVTITDEMKLDFFPARF